MSRDWMQYLTGNGNFPEYKNPWESQEEKKCTHEWHETVLMFSKVYDCKKCGVKKEDEDKK